MILGQHLCADVLRSFTFEQRSCNSSLSGSLGQLISGWVRRGRCPLDYRGRCGRACKGGGICAELEARGLPAGHRFFSGRRRSARNVLGRRGTHASPLRGPWFPEAQALAGWDPSRSSHAAPRTAHRTHRCNLPALAFDDSGVGRPAALPAQPGQPRQTGHPGRAGRPGCAAREEGSCLTQQLEFKMRWGRQYSLVRSAGRDSDASGDT